MDNQQITIQEIINFEKSAGRDTSKHFWTRQFVEGRIVGAEKVHLGHTNALIWVCEMHAYQQFVADNLVKRDLDSVITNLRANGTIKSGLDGWFPLDDAAVILRAMGYKKTSYQSLRAYCNEHRIKWIDSDVYRRRAISIDTMRNWDKFKKQQGRPSEKAQG